MLKPYVYILIALIIIAAVIIYLSPLIINCKASQYQVIISVISPYRLVVKPVLYTYTARINSIAFFLNLTNPNNRPMNVTINVYFGYKSFVPNTLVLLPPNTSVLFPVMLALFDSSHIYYASYGMGNFPSTGTYSMREFTHMNVTLTMTVNGLTNTTYGTSIIKAEPMKKPMGFALHWQGLFFDLILENPLPTALTINGYVLYSHNGSLLASCILSSPLIVNSTSIIMALLPTGNYSLSIPWTYIIMSLSFSQESQIPSSSIACAMNYTFPFSIAKLPYGYVVLITNIGNITIPLVPGELWWRS
ncbi:MAG: hypothetical protein ACP5L5_05285 [Vulcanisaeta sp.]|uniref:hypothetical protein n=1 Tax=Vulcanisaeta sp. TaxID=2020871 RepID=UPI003D0D837A